VIGEFQYVSKRFDSGLNRDISPYSLVNLKGSYLLHKNLSLFVRIDNLFNKSYEEAAGYGTPGISAFGGIKVSFYVLQPLCDIKRMILCLLFPWGGAKQRIAARRSLRSGSSPFPLP
jgi:hypothetical protein